MTPIEHRVDSAFLQALNCAEHRVPRDVRLQPPAFSLALGLRYGLLGAAATHELFTTTEESQMPALRSATKDWEHLVDTHVRLNMLRRMPEGRQSVDHELVARYSEAAFHEYLSGYFRGCSLSACLDSVVRILTGRYRVEVTKGWPWYQAMRAKRIFGGCSAESLRFALLFFERRKAQIQEVPEIALLGE